MIKTITATWFETKIRAKKQEDDGLLHIVTETYAVDAVLWGDAEKRITEEMLPYYTDKFEIVDIKKAAYREVFFDDRTDADKWYKCKVAFITIDEKSSKEKRNNVYYLVQAANIDKAKANIDTVMSNTMIDYEVLSVVETKILETYAYHKVKVTAEKSQEPQEMSEANKEFVDSIPDGMVVSATTERIQKIAHDVEAAASESTDQTTRKEIPKDE